MEEPPSLEDQAPPWSESHGFGSLKVALKDVNLYFKLSCPNTPGDVSPDGSSGATSPSSRGMFVEPYFTSVALFDARSGMKMSEDFHFDLNPPKVLEGVDRGSQTSAEAITDALPHLKGLAGEWMSSPSEVSSKSCWRS